MTQQPEIKTLNGGSIDYSHYIAMSHTIRSNDAHRAMAIFWRSLMAAWKSTKSSIVVFRRSDKSYTATQKLIV